MHLGFSTNEYGKTVSVHRCEFCGEEFTVIPPIPVEKSDDWKGCMAPECDSYDFARDADVLFDMGLVKTKRISTTR